MDAKRRRRVIGARLGLAVSLGLAASGCHSMRFDVAPERPLAETVRHRKAFFLWGLAPTREVVLTEHCPHGVVAVREETSFTDGLLDFVTLGIYSPRSSWYFCAEKRTTP